ncbi:thiazole synthase [Campylobacter jejuni]
MQENLKNDKLKIGKYDKLKIGKYDKLKIGKYEFDSRFILGSGKYSLELIKSAIEEAKAEIITLALRRANTGEIANILDYIPKNITLLPNTSGSRNADEALRIARLSRELGCGELIKIEVISDSRYLLPDNYETIKACELLAKEGFTPLPYMHADLYAARAMRDAGAAAIMPLAAPIGSNKGLCAKEFIQILLNEIDLPIIVDAGIGSPAQACEAMQMGVSAVMINTAIAEAKDIALMARAFSLAVNAGRVAFLAGLASVSEAKASSPLTGFLRD